MMRYTVQVSDPEAKWGGSVAWEVEAHDVIEALRIAINLAEQGHVSRTVGPSMSVADAFRFRNSPDWWRTLRVLL